MDKAQKIFDYEVVKKLGEGAFGQVILGIKNGEKVAIKKISKKQIIKVWDEQYRSINCTNPSSKSRYFTN